MKGRSLTALGALLCVQLLLAAGLALAGPRLSAGPGEKPLLALDAAVVDRIVIDGKGGAHVVVARGEGGWRLPELGGFPTEAGKADRLLSRLAALRHGDPVATSAAAAKRFEVSDGSYERRIALESHGKSVATLYVGTAAGLRSVHARAGGQDAVVLADLSTWEAPASADEWADRTVLHVPRPEIEAIEVGGLRLERVPAPPAPAGKPPASGGAPTPPPAPAWRATGLAAGATLDQGAADRLAGLVADLTYAGVLGSAAKPEWGLDAPVLLISVRRAGKGTVEYRLARLPDGTGDVLKASSRPEYFRVSSATADELVKAASRETLAGHAAAPGANAAAKGGGKPAARAPGKAAGKAQRRGAGRTAGRTPPPRRRRARPAHRA